MKYTDFKKTIKRNRILFNSYSNKQIKQAHAFIVKNKLPLTRYQVVQIIENKIESLQNLDGKTLNVKFKVNKYKPNAINEL